MTRDLAGTKKTATDLWQTVKPLGREVQSEAGGLLMDDSLEEKPDTAEKDIVCWHYDSSQDRLLTGPNFLPALSHRPGGNVPVGLHLVAKTAKYTDPNTQKEKRRSPVAQNAVCQEISTQAGSNRLPCRFVLFEGWFASADPRVFRKQPHHRDFLCPLTANRNVALSAADQQQGR